MGNNHSQQDAQLAQNNAAQAAQQARQNALLDANKDALSKYLSGNIGYSPQQLASLNTSVLDQNAQKYQSAQRQANEIAAARGGGGATPVAGTEASGYGNLQASKASDLSAGLNTVVQNNAALANSNMFNAASVLSGNAQTYGSNIGTYGQGANSALQDITSRQNNSFGTAFGQALGKGLGGGISGIATAGFGGALGGVLSGAGAASGAGRSLGSF